MSAISVLIKKHDNGDPDDTTKAVMDSLKVPPKWRLLFWPLLRDECRRSCRDSVRDAEIAATGHASGDTQVNPAGGGDRTDYLSERFYNGSKYVTWGEATVQDHRDRIAFLATLRNGIQSTIDRHSAAIETLEAAKATCLDALSESVAA